jgi:hypothetical protein
MVFSNLEKAMGAVIGLELAAPGFTRAAARTAVTAIARGGARVAVANPYAAGAAIGLGALQTAPGQDLLAMAEERGRQDRLRLERFVQDTLATTSYKVKKRKKSSFNAAVSAGMKAIKASKSFGKKGSISNGKKAFSMVTKVASGLLKGRKAPKSGARRIAYRAMPKTLKGIRK